MPHTVEVPGGSSRYTTPTGCSQPYGNPIGFWKPRRLHCPQRVLASRGVFESYLYNFLSLSPTSPWGLTVLAALKLFLGC